MRVEKNIRKSDDSRRSVSMGCAGEADGLFARLIGGMLATLLLAGTASADTLILPAQGIRHEGILLSLDVQGSQGMVRFTSVETFPHTPAPSFGQRGVVGVSVVINVDTGSELYTGCTLSSLTYMEPGSASLTVSCP